MSTVKFQITLELILIQPYDDERTIVDDIVVQLTGPGMLTQDGRITQDGNRILTTAFTHGLVGCARIAEMQNWCTGEAVIQNAFDEISQVLQINPKKFTVIKQQHENN